MAAREHSYELIGEIVEALNFTAFAGLDAVIVPDRIVQAAGGLVAGYRPDTQSLRVFLRNEGLRVELATPPGAQAVSYEEHDATWVLPLVLSVPAGATSAVIAHYVLKWLNGVKGASSEEVGVIKARYRVGELDLVHGKVTVHELEAPLEELARALKARSDEPTPPS